MRNGDSPSPRGAAAQQSPRRVNHFMRRATAPHRYEGDEHDLLPTPKKPARLPVDLADAEDVAIRSKKEEVHYKPTKRPVVKFAGTLVVEDVPEEEVAEESEGTHAQKNTTTDTKAKDSEVADAAHKEAVAETVHLKIAETSPDSVPVETGRVPFKDKIKLAALKDERVESSATSSTKTKQTPPSEADTDQATHIRVTSDEKTEAPKKVPKNAIPLHNTQGVIGMQRERMQSRNPRYDTLAVGATVRAEPSDAVGLRFMVPVSLSLLVVMFLLLGVESTTVVINNNTVTSYQFSFSHITTNFETALNALVAYSQNWVR